MTISIFNVFPVKFPLVLIIMVGFAFVLNSCRDSSRKVQENDVPASQQSVSETKNLRHIEFLPYWVPSVQFAGYYMAVEKGIYAKYGMDVHIIPYIPFITTNDLIKQGKVDFAALWLLNAVELKASGTDIVNIAQPSARSSLMLVTKKKSGIDSIEKMNGKKCGIWSGYELQPRSLFRKYKIDCQLIPIGSTNNLFLMDGVDITAANWFDEYHTLINSGLNPDEMNTFFFADLGLNFLEDGIYCSSEMRKNEPDLCRDFVKATFEGWKYAFEHPDETIDFVISILQKARLPVNKVHQKWMLDRYRDLYYPGENPSFNTVLKHEDYDFVGKALKDGNLIREIPSFDSFYQPVIK